jgi:hypothetical protein
MDEKAARRTGSRRAVLGLIATAVGPAVLRPRAARAAATTSRELDLPEFDRLVLQVPADVRIRIGSRHHARIEAEQKVIDRIAFRGDGRTLRVAPSGSFQTEQAISIDIEVRRLSALEAQASAEVTLEGLQGQSLEVTAGDSATVNLERLNLEALQADIGGSATVNASGKAAKQKAVVAGAATYDAKRLQSGTARIEASGSSDVLVDSRELLEVDVSGAATVQYAGKPRLKQSVAGAGTLERL